MDASIIGLYSPIIYSQLYYNDDSQEYQSFTTKTQVHSSATLLILILLIGTQFIL